MLSFPPLKFTLNITADLLFTRSWNDLWPKAIKSDLIKRELIDAQSQGNRSKTTRKEFTVHSLQFWEQFKVMWPKPCHTQGLCTAKLEQLRSKYLHSGAYNSLVVTSVLLPLSFYFFNLTSFSDIILLIRESKVKLLKLNQYVWLKKKAQVSRASSYTVGLSGFLWVWPWTAE